MDRIDPLEEKLSSLDLTTRQRLWKKMREKQQGYGLGQWEKNPVFAMPLRLTRKKVERVKGTLGVLREALLDLEEVWLAGEKTKLEEMRASLTAKGERMFARWSSASSVSRERRARRLKRYDGFFLADSYQLIEWNQLAPGAHHTLDSYHQIQRDIWEEMGLVYPLQETLAHKILAWLVEEYRAFKGDDSVLPKVIAVTYEMGFPAKLVELPGSCQRMQSLSQSFWGKEIELVVCEPSQISLTGSTLRVTDAKGVRECSMVWDNSVYLDYPKGEIEDFLEVLKNSESFLVVNDFGRWSSFSKVISAWIWQEDLSFWTEDQLRVLRYLVPKTIRTQSYRKDFFEGSHLVKRCDSSGGVGVFFSEENEFARRLEVKDPQDIVQTHLSLEETKITILRSDGSLEQVCCYLDSCPYEVGGEVSDFWLQRGILSDSSCQKHNLTENSIFVPCLIAENSLA